MGHYGKQTPQTTRPRRIMLMLTQKTTHRLDAHHYKNTNTHPMKLLTHQDPFSSCLQLHFRKLFRVAGWPGGEIRHFPMMCQDLRQCVSRLFIHSHHLIQASPKDMV